MLLINEKTLISLFNIFDSFKQFFNIGKKMNYKDWKDIPLDENFPNKIILESGSLEETIKDMSFKDLEMMFNLIDEDEDNSKELKNAIKKELLNRTNFKTSSTL
ncbi:MAG: hypothetical protein C0625_16450 [Arcobacter sp.]|nr:MAG: hypothetical protein C0625_16450 [Arcobacter sp.]